MNSKLRLKNIFVGGCFLVCLALAGCWDLLTSGTFTTVYYLEDAIVSTDDSLNSVYVDLSGNEDWEDHKGNIERIEGIEFWVRVTNHGEDSASAQIWITDNGSLTTPTEVESHATLVFDGPRIGPGDTTEIDREESIHHIEHLEELKAQVLSDSFHVYVTAKDIPFNVEFLDSVAFIITFTAGK